MSDNILVKDVLPLLTSAQLKKMCDLYSVKYTSKFKRDDLVEILLKQDVNKNVLVNTLELNLEKFSKRINSSSKPKKVKVKAKKESSPEESSSSE